MDKSQMAKAYKGAMKKPKKGGAIVNRGLVDMPKIMTGEPNVVRTPKDYSSMTAPYSKKKK